MTVSLLNPEDTLLEPKIATEGCVWGLHVVGYPPVHPQHHATPCHALSLPFFSFCSRATALATLSARCNNVQLHKHAAEAARRAQKGQANVQKNNEHKLNYTVVLVRARRYRYRNARGNKWPEIGRMGGPFSTPPF